MRSERSGAEALRGLVGEDSDIAISVTETIRQALAGELPKTSQDQGEFALLEAIKEAESFYAEQAADSWVPHMMTNRRISSQTWQDRVGYAPATWTALTDHLRNNGFSDQELTDAGLSQHGKYGLIDRFGDRAMFSVQHGFVGRRNPDRDNDRAAGPKYLNSPGSVIYHKRETLSDPSNNRLGIPVLVEGPMDALAVIEASQYLPGQYRPLAASMTRQLQGLCRREPWARLALIEIMALATVAYQGIQARALGQIYAQKRSGTSPERSRSVPWLFQIASQSCL